MSYCRWSGGSDVYLIFTDSGWLCVGCSRARDKRNRFKTLKGFLGHLERVHIANGDKVPGGAMQELRAEWDSGVRTVSDLLAKASAAP